MKCVFFDRDGIVNVSPGPGYVERWEDFHLQAAFVRSAQVAIAAGYACAIVTNQRGVALGRIHPDTLDTIHARLRAQLAERGVALLDIAVCPHARGCCTCRKPQPGMLLQLAGKYNLDIRNSWMVGDQETDIEAGCAAGCRTIRVGSLAEVSRADLRVAVMDALPALLEHVLSSRRRANG